MVRGMETLLGLGTVSLITLFSGGLFLRKSLFRKEEQSRDRFLNGLLDNLPLLVYVKDARDLRILNFNEYGLRLLNLRREDVIGKDDFHFCSSADAEEARRKDFEVIARKRVVQIPVEELFVPGRGKSLFQTRKTPIYDEAGEVQYLLVVSEDITEKVAREKRVALELQEEATRRERQMIGERERLLTETISRLSEIREYQESIQEVVRSLVPSIGDWAVISLMNEAGVLVRSAGAHRDLDLRPYLDEFMRNFPPGEEDLDIQRAIVEGESTLRGFASDDEIAGLPLHPRKKELYKILGTNSWIIVPLVSGDVNFGVLGIARGKGREGFDELDLAHARELARRAGTMIENARLLHSTQKAVRSRDEFLTIASHELKTPITSLRLQLEMLLRPGRFPELQKPLRNAVGQVDRLALLVNDLLDVGRLESGKLNYHLDLVGIGELVREVTTAMLPQFNVTGTDLQLEIEGNPFSFVDRYRMEQALVNLLNNALKYGPGRPVIVKLYRQESSVVLKIRDRGVGIAADQTHKIFEKFERGGKTFSVAGLGLGLYLTREIIHAFRGKIEVESVEGEFTEFTVTLPGP